jgi:hypothetical protein
MRRMGTWLTISLVFAAGCSSGHHCRIHRHEQRPTAYCYVEAPARPSSNLLFDRAAPTLQPGQRPITAEAFAYRSDWPATPGYYSAGEAVFFRSWYYSDQGDDFNNFDYVTRQFQSYRYGTLFR